MKKNEKNGFTLVELLAVIVILAIILVIAVPKVMNIITDAKKGTLESTAKMIAGQAEKQKIQNEILGDTSTITCEDLVKLNDVDYGDCNIDFEGNTAKVTIEGSGKFEGLWICDGTKTNATATNESCGLRTLTVNLDGGTVSENQNGKYEAGSEVTLIEPTKEGYTFENWVVESGEGAVVSGNTLTMGTTATEVKAIWEEINYFAEHDWSTIVAAVQQAEANGTEYPYNIGDEKAIDLGTTLGTHTVRIANKTKCSAVSVTSKTACGFVLEFKDIITTHEMNGDPDNSTTSTNAGGWPNTKLRAYLNDLDANDTNDGVIYNALPDELKEGIIDTYVISSKGEETITGYENVVNGNFYSTDKLYLLSLEEVYGTSFTSSYDISRGTSRQLDYYATYEGVDSNGVEYIGVSTTNKAGAIKYKGSRTYYWWLRSACSYYSDQFYSVWTSGDPANLSSYDSNGVAPAFRLAN